MRIFNVTGRHVSNFKCDLDSIFLSSAFTLFMSTNGIRIEPASTDTYQQNPKAEAFMRYSLQAVRTYLIQSSLPLTLWDEALMNLSTLTIAPL